MKKLMPLAASIVLILVASLFASAGTLAIFSDTETSTGNTLTAGTLDLEVDSPNPVMTISVSNIAPGWQGIYQWTLHNVGSLPGYLYVEFSPITNNDNGCNDPETEAETNEYGAVSPGADEGELGAYLRAWVLKEESGTINRDIFGLDAYSHNNQGYQNSDKTGYSFGLNWLGGRTSESYMLPAGESTLVQLTLSLDLDIWNRATFPGGTNYDIDDNVIQSDSVEFDIIFHLDQLPIAYP